MDTTGPKVQLVQLPQFITRGLNKQNIVFFLKKSCIPAFEVMCWVKGNLRVRKLSTYDLDFFKAYI